MKMNFFVEVEPIGKGRPRVTRFGTHTPKATVTYERLVKVTCQDIMRRNRWSPITGPAVLHLTFYLTPPVSWSKKRRQAILNQEEAITGRYDWDNMAKAICDALNATAYADDRLIVEAHVYKRAAETPGVHIVLEAWSGGDAGYSKGPDVRGGSEPAAGT